jgi:hypothetical protein
MRYLVIRVCVFMKVESSLFGCYCCAVVVAEVITGPASTGDVTMQSLDKKRKFEEMQQLQQSQSLPSASVAIANAVADDRDRHMAAPRAADDREQAHAHGRFAGSLRGKVQQPIRQSSDPPDPGTFFFGTSAHSGTTTGAHSGTTVTAQPSKKEHHSSKSRTSHGDAGVSLSGATGSRRSSSPQSPKVTRGANAKSKVDRTKAAKEKIGGGSRSVAKAKASAAFVKGRPKDDPSVRLRAELDYFEAVPDDKGHPDYRKYLGDEYGPKKKQLLYLMATIELQRDSTENVAVFDILTVDRKRLSAVLQVSGAFVKCNGVHQNGSGFHATWAEAFLESYTMYCLAFVEAAYHVCFGSFEDPAFDLS